MWPDVDSGSAVHRYLQNDPPELTNVHESGLPLAAPDEPFLIEKSIDSQEDINGNRN